MREKIYVRSNANYRETPNKIFEVLEFIAQGKDNKPCAIIMDVVTGQLDYDHITNLVWTSYNKEQTTVHVKAQRGDNV